MLCCSLDNGGEDDEWDAEDEAAILRASLAMSEDAMARAQVLMLLPTGRHSVPSF